MDDGLRRLTKYLSKRDGIYEYFGRIPLEEVGENRYILTHRKTKIYDTADKEKIVAAKIRGQKSAITRSINKARSIKKEYASGLFPEEYRSDKKYRSLLANLKQQRSRLNVIKRMTPDDIPTVVGGITADISDFQRCEDE